MKQEDINFLRNLLARNSADIQRYAMTCSDEISGIPATGANTTVKDMTVVAYMAPGVPDDWTPYVPAAWPPATSDKVTFTVTSYDNDSDNDRDLLAKFVAAKHVFPTIPTTLLIQAFLAVEEEDVAALANVFLLAHAHLKKVDADINERLNEAEAEKQDILDQQVDHVKNLGA